MVVALDVAVEPRRPGNAADLPDQALRGQLLQVAIDGAEADARKLPARFPVHPRGGGMVHGRPDHRENDRTLLGTTAGHN